MNSDKPILKLMDEFLADQDVSEGSRQKYRGTLHFFLHWLGSNGSVTQPTRQHIIAYRDYLVKSGKSAMTIDNYLVPVRQFFAYLADNQISDNVAGGIKSPKKPGTFRKDYLRPEQVQRLLGSIDRSTTYGMRDYAIISLMIRTGMRCIEVSRADVKDLRKDHDLWVIDIQGKGRHDKDRTLGITQKVVNPIAQYLGSIEISSVSEPMFRNHSFVSHDTRITPLTISKMIKRRLRSIDIDSPKITAHSFRHTAAITALKNSATLLEVSSMLGHSDIRTTMIYQKAIEAERMLEGTAVRKVDEGLEIMPKECEIKA